MKKIFLLSACVMLSIGFQACQSADKRSSTTKDSVTGDTTMVNGNHVTGSESTETGIDEEGATFLKKATVGGLMEIEAAKTALKNSSNAQVKAFAEQMITDHGKANTELKALAIKKKVITPDALPAEDQIHLDEMKKMTGKAFDKHYLDMMVMDHEKTVELFKKGMENKDEALKSWATATLNVIEMHTTKAKALAANLK